MIKGLVNILSKSSKDTKEWQNKWHKFFTDNERNLTPYESLWYIFDTAIFSINLVTEQNDEIIEKLKTVQNSIPNERNHQLLKDKLQEMQSTANRLSEEITDLKKQQGKLRTQISQQRTGSWRNTLRKKIFRTPQTKPNEKLNDISTSIKAKTKSFKNEEATFHREAANIIEQNTKAELRLIISMKQQFTDFVKSFNIFPNEFKEALARCNPKKDLHEWKHNILHKSAEQSSESSDEEEDHDQKTNRYLKSVKSRSIEDENSNNKKNIRQLSLRSRSVADKNREKKIKAPHGSSEFQAVKSDDIDGDN
ncbi:unnamed protein product [Rotaria sp. Silwood1]|nr:unnamed protein product [Rotaria sp. Silwood1]